MDWRVPEGSDKHCAYLQGTGELALLLGGRALPSHKMVPLRPEGAGNGDALKPESVSSVCSKLGRGQAPGRGGNGRVLVGGLKTVKQSLPKAT